ncbi:MAG TPA: TonB-dependent receptor, partial [Gemmataceae bacterium]|nr:TonB-dependent receptor [Gemmataceae bacterium]
MRRLSVVIALVVAAGVLASLPCLLSAFAAEPSKPAAIDDPNVQQAQAVPDVPITQPSPELAAVAAGSAPAAPTFGSAGAAPAAATPQQQAIASQPSANTVGGGEALTRPSSDVGDLLGKSESSTGVEVQRRSPIVTDPRVRGYHVGQLITQADGAYWFPARQDLDTIVSKIDSSLIQSIVVLKGPYSVRYGPGFSFIDVETLDTPRYDDGWQLHGTTAYGYKTNGQQQHGRQTLWGGTDEWGFRLGWDIGVGNDYESGNDTRMPSSYNSQNWNYAFGYTISPDSRIEFRGIRLDQHDVEFPGIVFDVNRLITDGYSARYTLENQCLFDRLTLDGWYNYTRFSGDDLRPGKQQQVPQLGPLQQGLLGFTQAHIVSTGFREATTWGKEKEPQLTFGVDLRYLSQYLNEFDITTGAHTFSSGNYAIPKSHSANPGLFLDDVLPVTERLVFKSGARVDLVSTDIDRIPPPFGVVQTEAQYLAALKETYRTDDFENDYFLWSAYLTSEYKLTPELTALAGVGYAMRPPTLTELYANQPLLAILQNGLTRVSGNPTLRPEQALQMDFGLRADYGRLRAGANG